LEIVRDRSSGAASGAASGAEYVCTDSVGGYEPTVDTKPT
jgi:hypothetical protein